MKRPNVVFVFADQMRAQATGYFGDPNVHTPNLDELSRCGVNFPYAVSGCPVCSPYRASLITGRYPLTHGVFLNDLCLSHEAVSLADAFKAGGYETAYIGKWHLDGHGRKSYIPPERRQGFDFWKVLECTHDYNHSHYYAGDSDERLTWEGYDTIAQTREAQRYLREETGERPFLLVLSWGTPHSPYDTAPQKYRDLYRPEELTLPGNVTQDPRRRQDARRTLAGYYAHITALDECVGDLRATLRELDMEKDTIFVFTSDHGDLVGSHGAWDKQQPYDESIRVPLLLRWPGGLGESGRTCERIIDAPDIMPTLLGLAGLPIPKTVEGEDLTRYICGGTTPPEDDAALLTCPSPFGNWNRRQHGGREYRGLRTRRYTYVRSLEGPWLLFDNEQDPCQLNNLVGQAEMAEVQAHLETLLRRKLAQRHDEFLPGEEYIRRWNYVVDERGTVGYTD